MTLTTLGLLVLGAVSITPQTVPARGSQQALLTLDAPAMVRLAAPNPQGTSCELVDHLRGPFASSGSPGGESCELDLLLDPGTYKVRLASPEKGKGNVELRAGAFAELNAPLLRLEPGRGVEQPLRSGQQASYWLHLDERSFVALRVSGRTAGRVHLWRNGQWVEEVAINDGETTPVPGQPIHEWWLQQWLEKGDYLLTVYGTAPKEWSRGPEQDFVSVAYGFAPAPAAMRAEVELPAWGLAAFEVPKSPLMATLALPAAIDARTELLLHAVGEKGELNLSRPETRCAVEPKALVPECAVSARSDAGHVLLVRGKPGTKVRLRWARLHTEGLYGDGGYGPASSALSFDSMRAGDFLVSVDDVPGDPDDLPLACVLEQELAFGGRRVLAHDFVPIASDKQTERQFNYGGGEATFWFGLERGADFLLSTSADRKARCELYRLQGDERTRLSETGPVGEPCRIERPLPPGAYELRLYDGNAGIETLRLVPKPEPGLFGRSKGPLEKTTVAKTGCLFPRVRLETGFRYRVRANRVGRVTARGLFVRPLPLELTMPLPLELPAGASLELPLGSGGPLEVFGPADARFSCASGGPLAPARAGACRLADASGTLTLRTESKAPVGLVLLRPVPPPELAPLQAWAPTFAPLPRLGTERAAFFDFERDASHSMLFEVPEGGLYHLTTEGLLNTECRLRTAATPMLATNQGGGRGRNCLVATYLRPGEYMATVRTLGQSRGRAGVRLVRQPTRQGPALTADDQAFFRVDADALVQQRLTVEKRGRYALQTYARSARLSCRLEDAEGWPLVRVPTSCRGLQELEPGRYLWSQLPMTVESMRRTLFAAVQEPQVLQGNRSHAIALNRWHSARLGEDGKDRFRFELEADLEVEVSLTDAMQGRVYRLEGKKKRTAVEVVPPGGDAKRIALSAGRYELETEHSRADVGISYRLRVLGDTLVPGMTKGLDVPARAELRVGREGVLRLKTEGDLDVRCRLFDAAGRLVAESSDNGEDWNCAFAEPVAAGRYTLVLESETLDSGVTVVTLAMPPTEKLGALADGSKHRVGGKVLVAGIPAQSEGVQEIDLRARGLFSCALSDASGRVVARHTQVRICPLLVRHGGEPYRLMLWTLEAPTRVYARIAARPIEPFSGGRLPAGKAGRALIETAGRYETGRQVYCLPEAERGPLQECGPMVSFEPGPIVFSAFGEATRPTLGLQEVVVDVDRPSSATLELSRRRFVGAQESRDERVHLLQVRGLGGIAAAPACELEEGAQVLTETGCFAASGAREKAVARWWSGGEEGKAEVIRRAVALPGTLRPLGAGRSVAKWEGEAARFALPPEPARLSLLVPPEAWAVQLDARGRAIDLCPPGESISRCLLSARGGELLVVGGEGRLEAEVITGEAPAKAALFAGLHESSPRAPGRLRLEIPPASLARRIEIQGASGCSLRRSDGVRIAGCAGTLPGGVGAEAVIEHGAGPLRAAAFSEPRRLEVLFPEPPASSPRLLPEAEALALSSGNDRTLDLAEPAVVHLRSDSGVCALFESGRLALVDGLGAGCRIDRLLPAGRHRAVVRAFGDEPLTGTFSWTRTAAERLAEGVGEERWLAPGEARLFRFELASRGRVGLGLRVPAETLECRVLGADQQPLGTGCQQLLELDPGGYLLEVRAPAAVAPTRFRPVLLGLAGAQMDVPEPWLRDFFNRIGDPR